MREVKDPLPFQLPLGEVPAYKESSGQAGTGYVIYSLTWLQCLHMPKSYQWVSCPTFASLIPLQRCSKTYTTDCSAKSRLSVHGPPLDPFPRLHRGADGAYRALPSDLPPPSEQQRRGLEPLEGALRPHLMTKTVCASWGQCFGSDPEVMALSAQDAPDMEDNRQLPSVLPLALKGSAYTAATRSNVPCISASSEAC